MGRSPVPSPVISLLFPAIFDRSPDFTGLSCTFLQFCAPVYRDLQAEVLGGPPGVHPSAEYDSDMLTRRHMIARSAAQAFETPAEIVRKISGGIPGSPLRGVPE